MRHWSFGFHNLHSNVILTHHNANGRNECQGSKLGICSGNEFLIQSDIEWSLEHRPCKVSLVAADHASELTSPVLAGDFPHPRLPHLLHKPAIKYNLIYAHECMKFILHFLWFNKNLSHDNRQYYYLRSLIISCCREIFMQPLNVLYIFSFFFSLFQISYNIVKNNGTPIIVEGSFQSFGSGSIFKLSHHLLRLVGAGQNTVTLRNLTPQSFTPICHFT